MLEAVDEGVCVRAIYLIELCPQPEACTVSHEACGCMQLDLGA